MSFPRPLHRPRAQRGVALVIGLILLVVMTLFGLLVVRNISGDAFPCSTNPDCSSQPCTCLRYRVTARVGEAGRAQVMLQSVYATGP